MSQRIVLYGIGNYGTRFYHGIDHKHYSVVGIYDKNLKALSDFCKGKKLNQYNDIEQLIVGKDNGEFDGIIICISDVKEILTIGELLCSKGIPVFNIVEHFKSLEKGCCRIVYNHFYEVNNVFCVNNGQGSAIGAYDQDGNMIEESYTRFRYMKENESQLLYWPLPNERDTCMRLEKCCVLGMEWTDNLWHFVYDCIWHLFELESDGYDGMYLLYDSDLSRTYIRLLDVDENRVIFVGKNDKTVYHIDSALISRHPGTGAVSESIVGMGRFITKRLSSKVVEQWNVSKVYFKRIGRRKALGIDSVLEEYGFETIIPEELSIEDQIALFSQADIVVCPHGAGSTNSIFLKEGAAFIELFGKSYIAPCCTDTIKKQRIRYRMLVETNGLDSSKDRMHYSKANDYYISEDILRVTLDELSLR